MVSMEHLAYDCRLLNTAGRSVEGARHLRNWLADLDSPYDPQAFVLRPDVVLRISRQIMEEQTPYLRTRQATLAALQEIRKAYRCGEVSIAKNELPWLDRLSRSADMLPDSRQSSATRCGIS